MDIVPKENGSTSEKTITPPSKGTDVPSSEKPTPLSEKPTPSIEKSTPSIEKSTPSSEKSTSSSETPKIAEATTAKADDNENKTEVPPAEDKKDVEEKVEEPEEVTKRSIRVSTWKKIFVDRQAYSTLIFNRIPNFVKNEEASTLFAETDEFKKAERIKVNVDYPQDSVKFKVISANKKLYVTSAKESKALYTLVDCPADADIIKQKEVIRKHTKSVAEKDEPETDIYNQEKLDIIVIGSVAVSRDGYRIGKGNGYVDLEFGILVHCGVITENTLIVTTVHDCQVFDTLPHELFKCYDVPVDMIVTPTEVIRVTKKLPRPTGIYWDLLSERRLGVVPILKQIKSTEEEKGKIIVLKSEDTDVESYRKRSNRFPRRRVYRFAKKSTTDENTTGGSNENPRNETERPRRRMNRGQRQQRDTNNYNGSQQKPLRQNDYNQGNNDRNERDGRSGRDGRDGGIDGGRDGRDGGRQGRDGRDRDSRRTRRVYEKDFCIKVSNIARSVRIKDLKQELRYRGCNPMYISWKAHYGKCYLHFGKRGTDTDADTDAKITETMKLLNDLSISVVKGQKLQDFQLKVELVQQAGENRIETVEVSSV